MLACSRASAKGPARRSVAAIDRHSLQRSAIEDFHVAAVFAGDRQERIGEPITRVVASNLGPGIVEGFSDRL